MDFYFRVAQMKKTSAIILLLLFSVVLKAQKKFRTIVPQNVINELQTILQQCEAVEFTNAKLVNDKILLLTQAKELLKKIESGLTK